MQVWLIGGLVILAAVGLVVLRAERRAGTSSRPGSKVTGGGAMDEPLLSEDALAEAARLDLPTTRRYVHDFVAYLDSQGSGPAQRWTGLSAQTLYLIHQLYQAGHSTEAIHRLLGGPQQPPRPPPAPAEARSGAIAPDGGECSLPGVTGWAQWTARSAQGTWRGVPKAAGTAWWRRRRPSAGGSPDAR